MADDFTLKWDAQNQELYGEDPSTGDRIPVPFDSVNIDKAVFNNTTVNVQSFTIADDDAVSFSAGSLKEVKVITDAGNFNGAWGADFGDLYEIWTAQATSTDSGSLSGTTGTDGQMTVSRDGNAVFIENRSGGQLSADIIKFER